MTQQLQTSLKKHDVLLFHLPTLAHSDTFCTDTMTSHCNRFSVHCWLRPQSLALNDTRFLAVLVTASHAAPTITNRCATFTTVRILITRTSCFLKLFNNSADSVSIVQHEWKLSMILSLHSNTRTTRRVKAFNSKHFLIHHI